MQKTPKKNVKVFFSYTHVAPEVNLYFINIFYEIANIHFDLNVDLIDFDITKTEKLIRDSDGFIGIYTFQEDKAEIKINLLELSAAIRSNKPIIVFYDNRLILSEGFYSLENVYPFSIEDVINNLSSKKLIHKNFFKAFVNYINAYSEYQAALPYRTINKLVIISLIESNIYNLNILKKIEVLLQKYNFNVKRLNNFLNYLDIFALINKADWIVADVNPNLRDNIISSFLFGQHIPLLRLYYDKPHNDKKKDSDSLIEYFEGSIVWNSEAELISSLENKLKIILSPLKRINSFEEAYQHFTKGLLRDETIFISYTDKDRLFVKDLIVELKKKFKNIIDYRDGASMFSGQDWRMQIGYLLEQSIIAIPILSKDYVQSRNCLSELYKMETLMKKDNLVILPIKVKIDKFDIPDNISSINYLRAWEYNTVKKIVEKIIDSYLKTKKI